jgi:wobble nucleotide-excising tRNase
MIEKIIIRNVATYDKQGITIDSIKPVNYLYGINGTGKTTISNYLQNSTDPLYESCTIEWKGSIEEKVLVYNKRFRERNFGKGKTAGVFTLGEATKEQIDQIEGLKKNLDEVKEKLIQKKQTIETQQAKLDEEKNSYRETVWAELYSPNKETFKEAFQGYLKKQAFVDKVLSEFNSNKSSIQTIEYLNDKAKTIFGTRPALLETIQNLDFSDIDKIETNEIWLKKVIGKEDVGISRIIQNLNINDWVNEGRKYLLQDNICPFCQQPTITEKFKTELEKYFDKTYTDDINLINQLSIQYEQKTLSLKTLLESIQTKEKNNPTNKLNNELFDANLKTVFAQISENNELFKNKKKEPSRSFQVKKVIDTLSNIKKIIDQANEAIKIHNGIVNNYQAERNTLITEIWKYVVESKRDSILSYTKKTNGLEKGIVNLTTDYNSLNDEKKRLSEEIRNANKNVTSIQPSIDEINRILKEYGFMNFSIVESTTDKNYYIIQREDGSNAESTLSEGEVTFLTFLYFLQLVKGSNSEENITEDRVLVIDDPISSLDSNILFVISSLLKEIVKNVREQKGNIKQIFVLTHNVYFHKEVSFIDGRTPKNSSTNFWMLRKNGKTTSLQSYGMNNPIQNSYELLWNELKNENNRNFTTIQNIMRRIIENYFKILGKYGDDELVNSFGNQEEREICKSLLCWINDGSHCIPDDLYIEQPDDVVKKYLDVFRKIFVNTKHEEHYNMMMQVSIDGET